MTIELSDEVLSRLQAEATRRGISVDVVVAELANALPAGHASERTGRRRPAFVAVGSSKGGISNRVDELLADGFGRD